MAPVCVCHRQVELSFVHELLAVLLLPLGGALVVLVLALLAAQCTLPRGQRGLAAVAHPIAALYRDGSAV